MGCHACLSPAREADECRPPCGLSPSFGRRRCGCRCSCGRGWLLIRHRRGRRSRCLRRGERRCSDDDDRLALMVFGRDAKLVARQAKRDGFVRKTQRRPRDGDLPRSNTQKAPEIDNCGTDLARVADQDIGDLPKLLAFGARDVLAEKAFDLAVIDNDSGRIRRMLFVGFFVGRSRRRRLRGVLLCGCIRGVRRRIGVCKTICPEGHGSSQKENTPRNHNSHRIVPKRHAKKRGYKAPRVFSQHSAAKRKLPSIARVPTREKFEWGEATPRRLHVRADARDWQAICFLLRSSRGAQGRSFGEICK